MSYEVIFRGSLLMGNGVASVSLSSLSIASLAMNKLCIRCIIRITLSPIIGAMSTYKNMLAMTTAAFRPYPIITMPTGTSTKAKALMATM